MSEKLSTEALANLERNFGFSGLRAGQQEVVEALLQDRSALAIFPTGGGKSLCYQLPALCWPGLTLVVSPLLALMRDQVDFLQSKGIAAARLDSTLGVEEVSALLQALPKGEIKLLYVAPERFANERFRKVMKKCRLELLAVDEAHCLSEWGHNFRPDYLKLTGLAAEFGITRCLALTATATPEVARDVQQAFAIADGDVVQTGFRRENLALHVTPCQADERDELLAKKVAALAGPIIVYVTLQHTAESVAAFLREQNLDARAYHAGMRSEAREEVQQGFMTNEIGIVVATIAFGMGIDKSDIRAVLHYNLPKTLENYVQEVGRAGRDGQAAHCEVFACLDDLVTLENFIFGDTPDAGALRNALDHLLLVGEEFDVSLYDLSRSCDLKPVVLETLLTYLELNGWVESRGSFFGERGIRFLRGEEKALAGHNERRQRYLRRLFSFGQQKWGWRVFDLREVAAELGEPIDKIAQTFEWWETHGDVALKVMKVRKRFRRLRETDSSVVRMLAGEFSEVFERREDRDLERLDRMVAFLQDEYCLTVNLLSYFGEEDAAPCGICSACGAPEGGVKAPPERKVPELSVEDLQLIQTVMAERQGALRSPRQIARFFCGITSPASAGAKLKKHRGYGILAENPFQDVLAAVEALGKRRI
jgi:ATP-dependent DNA helicase RecQ